MEEYFGCWGAVELQSLEIKNHSRLHFAGSLYIGLSLYRCKRQCMSVENTGLLNSFFNEVFDEFVISKFYTNNAFYKSVRIVYFTSPETRVVQRAKTNDGWKILPLEIPVSVRLWERLVQYKHIQPTNFIAVDTQPDPQAVKCEGGRWEIHFKIFGRNSVAMNWNCFFTTTNHTTVVNI